MGDKIEKVIKLQNVSKKFSLFHEKPTLIENLVNKRKREEFWALKNINVELDKNNKIGIIGENGSGKTTLLEIIAGITTPSLGRVKTNGEIFSLIGLDAGFHPELNGEENIFLSGLVMGLSKNYLRKNLKAIIKYSELGKFIDAPLYTYSQGMKLRLGFSIVAHADPDILLLDENLGVGDERFYKKSFETIDQFFKKGKTIVMVSHSLEFILKNCQRVIWLDKGEVRCDGEVKKIIGRYKKEMKKKN